MSITLNKRILISIAIILAVVGICVSLVIHLYHPLPENDLLAMKIKLIDKPNLQALYTHGNVTVIDCSSTIDGFNSGHRLPSSVWSTEPSMFFNSKRVLVVYSNDDNVSKMFCINLLRKVSVDVFLFQGGWNSWNIGG
jgi:hypothetical protein